MPTHLKSQTSLLTDGCKQSWSANQHNSDTMSVSQLTLPQCVQAVHQCIQSRDFRLHNPHLSPAELQALASNPPVWPGTKPVFSPYATTHDGYSQIRFQGTKFLMHTVAFKAFYQIDPQFSDVSHTLYLGAKTSQSVSPIPKCHCIS